MSAGKVDVLAVMDQAIERERQAGRPFVAQVAARAAVAKLIETATDHADAAEARETSRRKDYSTVGQMTDEMIARQNLRAALASIGGEP